MHCYDFFFRLGKNYSSYGNGSGNLEPVITLYLDLKPTEKVLRFLEEGLLGNNIYVLPKITLALVMEI